MLACAYSVKIGVILDVRFGRQKKLIKKASLHKNETCKLYYREL